MVFGFFALGVPELVILAMMLVGFVGVAAVVVIFLTRTGRRTSDDLAEENRRLRKRLDDMEDENRRLRQDSGDAP